MSEFHAEINPKDLLEFHIAMENLQPEKVLEGEWGPFLRSMQLDLQEYPPELPNQKYKRTGNLKRSWMYAVLSPTSAEIGNVATYAGWVQGEDQAAIHVGRWQKMREIGEEALELFVSKLSAKVGRVWTR
jgi:hypothetical protein